MSTILKWKRAVYFALAAGILAFSGYGIYHTAHAFNELKQSQYLGGEIAISSPSGTNSIVPVGASCPPGGCAVCSGCVVQQYPENIEAVPGSSFQVEQIY